MREVARKDLLHTYIKHGFDDEDDLDFYIQEYLHLRIPRKSFCPHHTSQFDFIADVVFFRIFFALAFGARGTGKTAIFSVINHIRLLFSQVPVRAVWGASSLEQTNLGYDYFKGFLEAEPLLYDLLDGIPIQSRTKFKNGSNLQIVAGTTKGFNGPHPQITTIDEVELIPIPLLEQGLMMSMGNNGIPAMNLIGSTRKYSNQTMATLLDEQEERNLTVRTFCIWETLEKCTRLCHDDPDWGNCLAWERCKGKAHDCDGWYPISTFVQKAATLSLKMFETELENKSPSGGTVVYGEAFDESIHVLSMLEGTKYKSFYSIFKEKDIPRQWRRIGGMDFGSHFAFSIMAIEPRYDIWILFYEYYFYGDRLLSKHADVIKTYKYWRKQLPIFSDPSGKQSILEMRSYGLNCLPAMNALIEGVDEVKKRLEIRSNGLPGLFIMDTCMETRRELLTWEHAKLPDGKPDLDNFEDGNDHCVDILRYECFTYPRMPKVHTKAVTIAGL